MQALLDNEASPVDPDTKKRTPMHYAACAGEVSVLELLCAAGAELSVDVRAVVILLGVVLSLSVCIDIIVALHCWVCVCTCGRTKTARVLHRCTWLHGRVTCCVHCSSWTRLQTLSFAINGDGHRYVVCGRRLQSLCCVVYPSFVFVLG